MSLQGLKLVGITALVFKFLSFTNIMILYIFLNVPYLSAAAKASLELFAKILFDQSIITIIYNMLEKTKLETGFSYEEK